MFLGSFYYWDGKFFSFTLLFNISWMPVPLFTYGLRRKYIVSAINKSIMPTAPFQSKLRRLMSLQADVRAQESSKISENVSKDSSGSCSRSQGAACVQRPSDPCRLDLSDRTVRWNSLFSHYSTGVPKSWARGSIYPVAQDRTSGVVLPPSHSAHHKDSDIKPYQRP